MESNFNENVKDLLHHHKKGTDHIKHALSIDESSTNKEEAIKLYRLGIEDFLLGLNIKLNAECQERSRHIQEKMESNLHMALERIEELSELSNPTTSNHKLLYPFLIVYKFIMFVLSFFIRFLFKGRASPRLQLLKKKIEDTRQERIKSSNDFKKTINKSTTSSATTSSGSSSSKKLYVQPKNKITIKNNNSTRPASSIIPKASSSNDQKMSLGKKLKIPNVDDRLVEFILDEIVESGQKTRFSDIGTYLNNFG